MTREELAAIRARDSEALSPDWSRRNFQVMECIADRRALLALVHELRAERDALREQLTKAERLLRRTARTRKPSALTDCIGIYFANKVECQP